jgi:uncharacterized protein
MKRNARLLLRPRMALLGVLVLALACASAPRLLEPRESGELVFWKVEGDADNGRAWLLGSVHFGTGDHDYDPAIDRAFDASEVLVMEVAPEELSDVRMTQVLLERGLLEGGQTLADVLSPATYTRLELALAAQGQSLFLFERMKPWVLVLTLASQQLAQQGYHPHEGVDRHFQQRADGRLPILGLESVEDQIAIFDELSFELQEHVLLEMLEKIDEPSSADLLVRAWRLGDLEVLEALVLGDLGKDPEVDATYEALYFRRNHRMTEQISALLEGGGAYFVVVGTGHMLGTEGIPALLAERGFEVRRVPRSP